MTLKLSRSLVSVPRSSTPADAKKQVEIWLSKHPKVLKIDWAEVGFILEDKFGWQTIHDFLDCEYARTIGEIVPSSGRIETCSDRYPHKCSCGAPAYVGFSAIDCSANCKKGVTDG